VKYKINPANHVHVLYKYPKRGNLRCSYWNGEGWGQAAQDPTDVPMPDLYVILVGAKLD